MFDRESQRRTGDKAGWIMNDVGEGWHVLYQFKGGFVVDYLDVPSYVISYVHPMWELAGHSEI